MTDGHSIFSREGGTAGSPTWSPDGKWIAFDARTRDATGDIWVKTAEGGEPRVLVGGPSRRHYAVFRSEVANGFTSPPAARAHCSCSEHP